MHWSETLTSSNSVTKSEFLLAKERCSQKIRDFKYYKWACEVSKLQLYIYMELFENSYNLEETIMVYRNFMIQLFTIEDLMTHRVYISAPSKYDKIFRSYCSKANNNDYTVSVHGELYILQYLSRKSYEYYINNKGDMDYFLSENVVKGNYSEGSSNYDIYYNDINKTIQCGLSVNIIQQDYVKYFTEHVVNYF